MNLDSTKPTRRTVVQALTFGTAACLSGDFTAEASTPTKLKRVKPESVGIDSTGILGFVSAVEQKVGGLHSLMILRHGQVAAEGWWAPYAPQHPHMLYSLSKSFTSTAMGFAVSEGKLSVDATVLSFFLEFAPSNPSENLKAMRVRHLLTMGTGHDKDATGGTTSAKDGNWVKAFLSLPVEHEPGSKFVYNSAATYMVSAIVHKLTGMTILEYLKSRLFEPLGISGQDWETCPRGINTGGWGLRVKTEDIARFGQCYLQKGMWDGKQVIPEKWVAEATSKHISNGSGDTSDWAQGYGYQFWRCRHGGYRGDGAFGQFCIVLPEQDVVIAITSGVGDMQAILNAAWEHLLPAIQSSVLPSGNSVLLKSKLSSLAIPTPAGDATSPTAETVTGKTYRFDSNEQKLKSAKFSFDGKLCLAEFQSEQGARKIVSGYNSWAMSATPLGLASFSNRADAKVAVKGAWTSPNTYVMTLCFYETPYLQTITCKFEDDQVKVETKENVAFGPTQHPVLVGRAT